MAHSLHSSSAKAKPVSQGKLTPYPNFSKERDRKVGFDGCEKGGSASSPINVKQQQQGMVEKPLPAMVHEGVPTGKQTKQSELPSFGEQKGLASKTPTATVHQYSQEYRLKGKLKWLFEQDRMFWESNSAKSSIRGSPEVDLSKGSRVISSKSNDAKLLHGVEEGLKKDFTKKQQPVESMSMTSNANKLKEHSCIPSHHQGRGLREETSAADHLSKLAMQASGKLHWTPRNSGKVWPHGPQPTSQASKIPSTIQDLKAKVSASPSFDAAETPRQRRHSVDMSSDSTNVKSSLDLGGEEFFSDYDDAPNSGESSEVGISETESEEYEEDDMDEEEELKEEKVEEEAEESKAKMEIVAVGEAKEEEVKQLETQATFLKEKCDSLDQERNLNERKWKQSCDEMDQAASMAQALRTAIETLLEASASDSTADFKTRQDMLESQTEALKLRMAKLGQKSVEGPKRRSERRKSTKSLEDRIETLKKNAEAPSSLASPDVPRDSQHKVEALRARLERLMLATNSRVTDDQEQMQRRTREKKSRSMDFGEDKFHKPLERGELKLKGWLNLLSAEMATEDVAGNSKGSSESHKFAHGRSSIDIPSAFKQPISMHLVEERENEGSVSATSSEEAKKKAIHKIAEEVKMEAEQWFQVQELLQRVGEDMASLQDACSTWEHRAIIAEAQVACLHHEGPDRKEREIPPPGDEKTGGLQGEMSRLRETVEDVRRQLGSVNLDPSRWFEAATNYGYAFMPINLHHPCIHSSSSTCACKGKCSGASSNNGMPQSNDQWRPRGTQSSCNSEPSSSINSPGAPLTISECETLAPSERRRKSMLASEQWINETEKEEDKLEFASSAAKELFPVKAGQEKSVKLMESGGASARERGGGLHQEEQLPRYSNFSSSLRRSPLRDVLENIVSSKENKRPL